MQVHDGSQSSSGGTTPRTPRGMPGGKGTVPDMHDLSAQVAMVRAKTRPWKSINALVLIGAITTLIVTLALFGIPVGQLLLGGALTSVFVGIAAQQSLSNVFAGLVLLFARPFQVGDAVRLQAGALGGTLDGIVTDIGITYVRFDTDGSVMSIPNSQVLNAVVGPIPPEPEDPEQDPEPEDPEVAADGKSGTPGGPEQPQPRPAGPA